jgi:glutathione S-transferase
MLSGRTAYSDGRGFVLGALSRDRNPMITIHHLGVSQSDRIVWLMEELELPYQLKWYKRKENRLAPDEYLALHPAATAPVIEDDGLVLAESGAIVEYICHRYADGRLTVRPEQANYAEYLYWMHFNNNILGLFFAKAALRAGAHGPEAERVGGLIRRREEGYFRFLEKRLSASPYLAGPEFTCADVMVMFQLTTASLFGGRKIDDLPHALAYVQRIESRPAYVRAMAIAGPKAVPPKG